ncbi:MAG: sulfite exporter TauE/SafE family protein, partial [Candidatus Auribacterota bacterium]|nr:sulfite exporter TauE/SafE family protein [Candidatus Auribacterota bacterium]
MTQYIIEGFLLGISTGFFCAGVCLPLLTPIMMLNIKKSFKQGLIIFGLFCAGRLIAYSLFGLSAGFAGLYLSELVIGPYIISASLIITSLLLLFFTYSSGKSFSFCLNKKTFENTTYLPLMLGFLVGINVCPPFLVSIPAVFRLASPTLGLLFFLSFFMGTTILLLPSLFGILIGKIKMLTPLIKIITIFIGLYFLTIGLSSLKNLIILSKPHQQIEESDIILFFPDANVIQVTPFHNSVFSAHSKDNLLGYIIISDGFGNFTGFSGPLTVGISTDPDFKISEVKILSHNEGAPYIKLLEESGYFKQFKNKKPGSPLVLDTDIDAVTGATVSSSAILNAARTSYKKASSLFAEQQNTLQNSIRYNIFPLIVIIIPFISCILYIFYKKKKFRYFTMFYSLIVLGFWKKTMLTGEHIANILTG